MEEVLSEGLPFQSRSQAPLLAVTALAASQCLLLALCVRASTLTQEGASNSPDHDCQERDAHQHRATPLKDSSSPFLPGQLKGLIPPKPALVTWFGVLSCSHRESQWPTTMGYFKTKKKKGLPLGMVAFNCGLPWGIAAHDFELVWSFQKSRPLIWSPNSRALIARTLIKRTPSLWKQPLSFPGRGAGQAMTRPPRIGRPTGH